MADMDDAPSRQSLRHNEVEVTKNRTDRRLEIDGLPSPRGSARGQYFDRTIPGHSAMKDTAEYLKLGSSLYEPEIARANIAASVEAPDGTMKSKWAEKHQDHSVLEQHCLFWDRDSDGFIWPLDTYRGFHELGYHWIISVMSMFIIHLGFAWFTMGWPDPFFRLNVKRMHKAKHGSDTGTYDREGRFVPARFEAIFDKYDRNRKGGLTFWEGLKMIHGNRMVWDPTGWSAAFLEWVATYLLAWPANGVVSKEFMRTVYDGSVFFEIAEREKSRSKIPFAGLFHHND